MRCVIMTFNDVRETQCLRVDIFPRVDVRLKQWFVLVSLSRCNFQALFDILHTHKPFFL